jgi:predicted HicB family RNase H-like nuclease
MARIVHFEAQWDDEADVWWAQSTGTEGIVTEAATVEALRERLKLIVPDFLEASAQKAEEIRIELSFTVSDVIQAA